MGVVPEQQSPPTEAGVGRQSRREFLSGFLAMGPFWVGAIPVGIAFGLAARSVEISIAETVLMSLTVFSAAAQVSAVSLIGDGAPLPVLVGTAVALNLQLLLIGLAVGRQVRSRGTARAVAAYLLTDAAYGVAVAGGRLTLARLTGAGASMFLAWNTGTVVGAVAGAAIPDPRRLGIDFVAPLMFVAVLVPLVRGSATVVAALVAGAVALLLVRVAPGGTVVLGAGLAGSVAGAWWWGRTSGAGDRAGESQKGTG